MAYQTGTSTNLSDLISDLMTFAVANGWTQDELDTASSPREAALHKGDVWVSFAWTTTPSHLSVHQALGYTGGNRAGTHPDDSGNGYNGPGTQTDANILTERCVNAIGDGPFTYHFFENDASPAYIHVAVETAVAGVWRHFGFGEIVKFGGADWVGGEYCYGHFKSNNSPTVNTESTLLDGGFNGGNTSLTSGLRGATLHLEDFPGQPVGSKWGNVTGADADPLNDTGGTGRTNVIGGHRGSMVSRMFAHFSAGNTSGLIPMVPVDVWQLDRTANRIVYLGHVEDVRGVNIDDFAAGQEVTIGSDVWVLFPTSKKSTVNDTDRSYNAGIAYRKVTA